jgi:predicted RNA-binding Zn ribbon-like protein
MLVSDMKDSPSALLLQDFVNTYDVECDVDEIDTPERLDKWLRQRGLLSAPAAVRPGDVRTARGLREGLRAAMLDHHTTAGQRLPPELHEALTRLPLRVSFATGSPALVPAADGAEAALGGVATAIMACVTEGTWPRLKVCQEDTCRWAFLDTSKNHSRAWCSMRVCGNRTKTRTYRARRRTEPAPAEAGGPPRPGAH